MRNDGKMYLRLSGAMAERLFQSPIKRPPLCFEAVLIVTLQAARTPPLRHHKSDLRNIDDGHQSSPNQDHNHGEISHLAERIPSRRSQQVEYQVDNHTDRVV